MSDDAGRVGRTVRLTADVNQRLLALCEHLGVNPNAYLVGEIGKAVSRDELSFVARSQSAELFGKLGALVGDLPSA